MGTRPVHLIDQSKLYTSSFSLPPCLHPPLNISQEGLPIRKAYPTTKRSFSDVEKCGICHYHIADGQSCSSITSFSCWSGLEQWADGSYKYFHSPHNLCPPGNFSPSSRDTVMQISTLSTDQDDYGADNKSVLQNHWNREMLLKNQTWQHLGNLDLDFHFYHHLQTPLLPPICIYSHCNPSQILCPSFNQNLHLIHIILTWPRAPAPNSSLRSHLYVRICDPSATLPTQPPPAQVP